MQMSLTCASDSTTSIGSSRGCSDSEFCNGCWTDDDGDGSEDGSVSAFQSDSTCDACAVLTPRGALARYDELIDELSPSTCDIFFGGSNSNDGDGEVQATSECPTYIRGKAATLSQYMAMCIHCMLSADVKAPKPKSCGSCQHHPAAAKPCHKCI